MTQDFSENLVHIACVSNSGYIPHFATMLVSLAASNSPGKVAVHLLHDDSVTPELQHQLMGLADRLGLSLDFRQPTEALLQQLPPRNSHYPEVVWFNIMVPEVLTELDRVLYLDGDVLVMQDLRPLWNTDLGGALFGAVAQPSQLLVAADVLARLNLAPDAPYLNSGVILMDLQRMRAESTTEMTLAVGRDQERRLSGGALLYLMDQDALNEACAGRWIQLHPRWNALAVLYLEETIESHLSAGRMEDAEAAASPAIVHFEGLVFAKPWNYRCVHPFQPLYLAYRRETPWPLERLDDATLMWKVLRRFPPKVQVRLAELKQRVQRLVKRI